MSEKSLSVKQAIRERRSIKLFNGEPVNKEEVLAIFEEAKWAPNHGNRRINFRDIKISCRKRRLFLHGRRTRNYFTRRFWLFTSY